MARFSFIKLPVTDLEAQGVFYAQAFGFAEEGRFSNDEMDEIVMRQSADDTMLCLMRLKNPPAPADHTIGVLGFTCDDIDGALTRAMDAGAELKQSVFAVQGIKIALVFDPEGNEIEFVQFS